jgi:hypothetical protein
MPLKVKCINKTNDFVQFVIHTHLHFAALDLGSTI